MLNFLSRINLYPIFHLKSNNILFYGLKTQNGRLPWTRNRIVDRFRNQTGDRFITHTKIRWVENRLRIRKTRELEKSVKIDGLGGFVLIFLFLQFGPRSPFGFPFVLTFTHCVVIQLRLEPSHRSATASPCAVAPTLIAAERWRWFYNTLHHTTVPHFIMHYIVTYLARCPWKIRIVALLSNSWAVPCQVRYSSIWLFKFV